MKERGILLHISSLPSKYGIGDIGPSACEFVDWLARNGYKYWQLLPLNYCGYGNSPYNPLSSFAAFPYLISPELLYEQNLITKQELEAAELPDSNQITYEAVYRAKDVLFSSAIETYLAKNDIEEFISSEASWLKPFMAFITLVELYQNSAWYRWDASHKSYSEELYQDLYRNYTRRMKSAAALQAIFSVQYTALLTYIKNAGISLIGDIPLYVAFESADVWANQSLFSLDHIGDRIMVAGVPPDAFSEEGQLWGNPVYLWDRMAKDDYHWFKARIAKALTYYDYLRLDHFIGYVNYWEIPAAEQTAIRGRWVKARPEEFFASLVQHCGADRFIAEDLGILSHEVCHIRDSLGFPGMIILQFCFDEKVPDIAAFPADKLIYPGTHDNHTTRGWYENYVLANPDTRKHLTQYLIQNGYIDDPSELNADNIASFLIQIACTSPCITAIIPMQDVLGLDDTARTNIPGTALGNWQWRMDESSFLRT